MIPGWLSMMTEKVMPGRNVDVFNPHKSSRPISCGKKNLQSIEIVAGGEGLKGFAR
jgi:hypothetical protein